MSRKHCPVDVILTEAPEATLATTERFSRLLGAELALEFELFAILRLEMGGRRVVATVVGKRKLRMSKLPLIVFDVNETLLDLETMTPVFERIFRERLAMRFWFANLIMYSEALTLANTYVPFTEIGAAALKMLADAWVVAVTEADKKELTERFATMPPHPEVPGALRRLKDSGFRLFTLTDNLLEMQTRQLQHGGIADLFERRFSVDQGASRHKPAPEAYAYVQKELKVRPSELFLAASHTWDTLGAVAAGWGAALIRRPGNEILEVGPQPTFVGSDSAAIAEILIDRSSADSARVA